MTLVYLDNGPTKTLYLTDIPCHWQSSCSPYSFGFPVFGTGKIRVVYLQLHSTKKDAECNAEEITKCLKERSERRFEDILSEDMLFGSHLHKPSHYTSLQIAKIWENLPCKIQAATTGCFYKSATIY